MSPGQPVPWGVDMTEHERRELDPPAMLLSRGSLGPDVKRLQEWLCLHGFHTAIDGDFGPATEAALKAFQTEHRAFGWTPGVVTAETWAELTEPMRRVVEWKRAPGFYATNVVLDCAHSHLFAQPREVGGPNGGPWIRGLYMDGHDGKDYPWCAGFVTTVLRQALGHDKWRTFSCDELAAKAMRASVFRGGEASGIAERVRPGDLFLIRAADGLNDWAHCGIVTAVGADYFETIEGNTTLDGSRDGTAVHARMRAFKPNVDFVLIGGDRA